MTDQLQHKNSAGGNEATLPAEFIAVCVLAFVAGVSATVYFCHSMWCEMDKLDGDLPADVAGDDGGNDDAVGAADVSKNGAPVAFPLLHGVWILRHLAGSRYWNLCARRGVGDGCDAV